MGGRISVGIEGEVLVIARVVKFVNDAFEGADTAVVVVFLLEIVVSEAVRIEVVENVTNVNGIGGN